LFKICDDDSTCANASQLTLALASAPSFCASALGTSAATTIAFRRKIFCARKKYSSRTGCRVLYFSPVEFFRGLVVPCAMFSERASEFQIAARTRGAGCVAIRRAPQPRLRISRIPHHWLAPRRFTSEELFITTASRILIVTPRLEFPASATKQTLPAISNRYKLCLLQLGVTCTSRFAAVPSSLQPVPKRSAKPTRYRSHLRFSKPAISNLQAARRIRDTCNDIPSLRAFPRCYASCGSRRKSE